MRHHIEATSPTDYRRQLRQRHKELGLCGCGHPPVPGFFSCAKCQAKNRTGRRDRPDRRRATRPGLAGGWGRGPTSARRGSRDENLRRCSSVVRETFGTGDAIVKLRRCDALCWIGQACPDALRHA